MTVATLVWLGAIAGLFLLYRFLRGRRTGDHPYCRRCAFDLTGLPPTSTRCPECGADITAPRSVRIGQRTRPKSTGALALLLLLVTLPFVSVSLLERLSTIDTIKYKPAFWLAHDARANDRRADVLNELLARVRTNRLPASTLSPLIEHALSQQADRSIPWDLRWGGFIEQAEALSAVSQTQWERYASQSTYFELRPDTSPREGEMTHDPVRVRRGSDLSMVLVRHERLGPMSRLYAVHGDRLFIGLVELVPFASGQTLTGAAGDLVSRWRVVVPAQAVRHLPDGPHDAVAKFEVQIRSRGRPATTPVARYEQSIPLRLTLAPHHDYTDAPGYRTAFERALTFSNIHLTGQTLHLTATLKDPPTGFAHTLVLKSAAGDTVVDPLVCPAGQTISREFHVDLRHADLPTARLHFIPVDAIVSQTNGIPVVWSGSLDRPLPLTPQHRP